jgi:hypothetical protein
VTALTELPCAASAPNDGDGLSYGRAVLRWLCALVVGAVVSWFALMLVAGQGAEQGPILFAVWPGHGVHRSDLLVLAGWLVSLLALLVLVVAPASRREPVAD